MPKSATARSQLGKVAGIACAALLLTGCAYNQYYPAAWAPPVAKQDGCGAVAGAYDATISGELASATLPAQPARSLGAIVLLGSSPGDQTSVDRVTLAFDNDRSLIARGYHGSKQIAEQRFSERDGTLQCSSAGATIDFQGRISSSGLEEMVTGIETRSTHLVRATDGALVVEQRAYVAGLAFMLWPVSARDSLWLQFKPADAVSSAARLP